MQLWINIILFLIGLGLVIGSAEYLVRGVVATSHNFGLSAFLISVIFIGFDPENLGVGSLGSFNEVSGIALGSIFGAGMVAISLALGITAVITPLEFKSAPIEVLILPFISLIAFGLLGLDGIYSRWDGIILLLLYAISVFYLYWITQHKDFDIEPHEEVEEVLEMEDKPTKGRAILILVASLIGIIGGSELLVISSRNIISSWGISETFFGYIVLALLVSIEEIARELPAALKGHPEVTYGNVVGSILAFFLFNAGIIMVIHPIPIGISDLLINSGFILGALLIISIFLLKKKLPRIIGGILVSFYLGFAVVNYFL